MKLTFICVISFILYVFSLLWRLPLIFYKTGFHYLGYKQLNILIAVLSSFLCGTVSHVLYLGAATEKFSFKKVLFKIRWNLYLIEESLTHQLILTMENINIINIVIQNYCTDKLYHHTYYRKIWSTWLEAEFSDAKYSIRI